ncbi:site-2 protease family protein [Desulfofustis limnaeus]|jgi:Zn-dependent protease|uniref:Protease n=1 Tax=Desulfofustis limnaeus TaxID=2740163 RepID=A0ABN6LZ18_9BACT|nr:site-2 protease family protein [Desulfofustis limnaeus]MDX9896873.1 site-2 protease family protein [Desulfofustis sp.]BDD85850.1 protease [Desulfofustis limnaeus]
MNLIDHLFIQLPPLLFALTLHEYAHGYIAFRLGDPTAQQAGRLSLNPLRHLDPLGTIAFFFIKIGWAKPVPVNPAYFRNPQQDMLWVALAGPLTNLLLAIVSAVLLRFVLFGSTLVPDSGLLHSVLVPFSWMLATSVWINLVLCVFNCLPIPPLDGGRIMTGLLPPHLARSFSALERYGFIIILLLAFSGLLAKLILPVISFANNLLLV